jgi:chromosome partitioning protein
VIPSVDENNVLATMRKAEEENDMVIVDLPGGSSTLALKTLQRSNFVLVPCQASLPDVRDAMKTIAQIDDAEELSRVRIARSLIWTRILPGFESRSAKHVRQSVEGREVPMFSAQLRELAAFRELHLTGQVPRQADPSGGAARNVNEIVGEVLSSFEKLVVAA